MELGHLFGTLIGLGVVFAAILMMLGNPTGANAMMSTGAGTISGLARALEGRQGP